MTTAHDPHDHLPERVNITRCEPGPDTGWWFGFGSTSPAAFQDMLARIKRLTPTTERVWHPDERVWWLSDAGLATICEGFPGLADIIARETGQRPGTRGPGTTTQDGPKTDGQTGQTKRPHTQRAPRAPLVPADVRDAFTTLHLLPSAPVEVVNAAWKALMKLHHTNGGYRDLAAAQRINDQHDIAEKWAERQATRPERRGA